MNAPIDLDDRLRRDLPRLADRLAAEAGDDPMIVNAPAPSRTGGPRHLLLAAAVALFAVGILATTQLTGGSNEVGQTGGGDLTTVTAEAPTTAIQSSEAEAPVREASQTPEDAARDFIVPAVAALTNEERASAFSDVVPDRVLDAEWRLSSFNGLVDPIQGDESGVNGRDFVFMTTMEEILLVEDEQIQRAYPFYGLSLTSLHLDPTALWAFGAADGANPFHSFVRIDRSTLDATVVLLGTSDETSGPDFDFERDWNMAVPDYWVVNPGEPAELLASTPVTINGLDGSTIEVPALVLAFLGAGPLHL